MPYLNILERRWLIKMIEASLLAKFGDEGAELVPDIIIIDDGDKLEALNTTIATATTLDEVRRACKKALAAVRRKHQANYKRRSAEV